MWSLECDAPSIPPSAPSADLHPISSQCKMWRKGRGQHQQDSPVRLRRRQQLASTLHSINQIPRLRRSNKSPSTIDPTEALRKLQILSGVLEELREKFPQLLAISTTTDINPQLHQPPRCASVRSAWWISRSTYIAIVVYHHVFFSKKRLRILMHSMTRGMLVGHSLVAGANKSSNCDHQLLQCAVGSVLVQLGSTSRARKSRSTVTIMCAVGLLLVQPDNTGGARKSRSTEINKERCTDLRSGLVRLSTQSSFGKRKNGRKEK
jgi:hypothetical protein